MTLRAEIVMRHPDMEHGVMEPVDLADARRVLADMDALHPPKARLRELSWADHYARATPEERQECRRLAFHEAGHATMAVLDGSGVDLVQLNLELFGTGSDKDATLGFCLLVDSSRATDLLYAAGVAAEVEAGFPRHPPHAEEALDCRRRLRRPRRSVEDAVRTARRDLRECWAATSMLARVLLQVGKIDGQAATELLLEEIPSWRLRMGVR